MVEALWAAGIEVILIPGGEKIVLTNQGLCICFENLAAEVDTGVNVRAVAKSISEHCTLDQCCSNRLLSSSECHIL